MPFVADQNIDSFVLSALEEHWNLLEDDEKIRFAEDAENIATLRQWVGTYVITDLVKNDYLQRAIMNTIDWVFVRAEFLEWIADNGVHTASN